MDGEPRKRSGCLVALYALFGIGLFFVVAGGIAAYFALKSERGQQFVQVVRHGTHWLAAASQAPGTAELRDAGCDVAMVSDAGSALDIFMTLVPEQQQRDQIRAEMTQRSGGVPLDQLTLVICTLPRFSSRHLACEDLARTYGNAVETAPPSFFVLVIKKGADQAACQGTYAPDGTPVTRPGAGAAGGGGGSTGG